MPKRCLGCMKIKESSPVCEHCGYNENVPNYAHQLPIGTVLKERYTVGKVLGQGGFGITYVGWDNALEAPIAIKEYYPNSFVTRECALSLDIHCAGEGAEGLFRHNRERFLKEAKILAKLQNVPGIVRVQNLFAENNTAYIVMEYVEGIDLKHYIRMQQRVLTVQETFSVLRPVMYALSKVHEAELVHRDISPDNIMILPDGTAKLLDFGAAREVENADVYAELPQSTEAILKHGFAPMEQYRRRGSLGPWTDVYALCATMYYCLTGKVPNSAPERIMGDDNVNWHQIPGLNAHQIATLEKGLALMPENRLGSMEQLYRGLFPQQKQTSQPRPAPKASDVMETNRRGGSSTLPKAAKPERKKKKPTALIAAALAAVAVVGLFFLKPEEKNITVELPEILPAVTVAPEGTEPITLSPEQLAYLEAEELEKAGDYGRAAIAFGKLGDFEDARERSFAIWEKITPRDSLISNGCAIRFDGTVVHTNSDRQKMTAHWRDIVKVTGSSQFFGLKADGTVVTATFYGHVAELDVSGWKDIVDISFEICGYSIPTSPRSSYGHSTQYMLGLKADGTVIATGDNNWGQCDVSGWTDIVAIATGSFTGKNTHSYPIEPRAIGDAIFDTAQTESHYYSVGIKADGTVVTAGKIPESWDLSGWTDIIKVSISGEHMAGLRSDGTVISTQYDASDWETITDIHAGPYHLLGLRANGTVAAMGNVYIYGHLDVEEWTDITAISATDRITVGLKADGTVLVDGQYESVTQHKVSSWTDIVAIGTSPTAMTYGLKADGTVSNQHRNDIFTDIRIPTKTLPVRQGNGAAPQEETVPEES